MEAAQHPFRRGDTPIEWVFPGATPGRPLSEWALYSFWTKMRDEAGIIADARLHDLRHSHAAHAIMNGQSLHMTERLLGHGN